VKEMHDTHSQGQRDVALSRIITVCFGVIGIVIAANVSRVGNIIEIAQKVIQTYTGPMLGIYLLGMFTVRANARGALLGGICGTAVGIYVAFFCKDASGHDRIAFLWPTVFGFLITFIGGYFFSVILGGTVSEKARQLTWRNVMRRPLADGDAVVAAAPQLQQA
jgi:SSS family solute:Na+ symporter